MKKIFLTIGLLFSLAGCATQTIADLPRLTQAEAISTFQELGYSDWVQSPFVRMEAICGAKKVDIAFSDLRVASYSLRQSQLILTTTNNGICGGNYVLPLRDLEDARRVVSAATSLGAKFDYFFARD